MSLTAAGSRRRHPSHLRLSVYAVLAALLLAGGAVAVNQAIVGYHDRIALRGLDGKPSPVALIVAGEPMAIPANMIRFRSERRGGPVNSVDLVLHWPSLEGFTEERAADFRDVSPSAPLIYARLSARDNDLDASARLDAIYSRFFDGPAFEGPEGLVGRPLAADSPYAGEIVFHAPRGGPPYAARCLAEATDDIPATCIRDVNIGMGLSLLYRFNHEYLADWRSMDDRVRRLINHFFRRQ